MGSKPIINTFIIIDDDEDLLAALKTTISSNLFHCDIITFTDGREAYSLFDTLPITAVILDWLMPYHGSKVLEYIATYFPEIPVVVITGCAGSVSSSDVMQKGARYFLAKPIEEQRLLNILSSLIKEDVLCKIIERLRYDLFNPNKFTYSFAQKIITHNQYITQLITYIASIATSREPVVLLGETGTGKGLFAEAIHTSNNGDGPYVTLNTVGLTDEAFEDELFGHVAGAFPETKSATIGKLGEASGGTLFLDEIGELTPKSQLTLLRLLQTKEYKMRGSELIRRADARIIASTNKDLNNIKSRGLFRLDLYYRLGFHKIILPALRDRRDDIILLCNP